jgi:hypothetical protein
MSAACPLKSPTGASPNDLGSRFAVCDQKASSAARAAS